MKYTQDIVKVNGLYWIQETHMVSELQAHTETVAGPYKTWEDADVYFCHMYFPVGQEHRWPE